MKLSRWVLHQFSFNMPPKGAEMNGLEWLLSAFSMRKGVIIIFVVVILIISLATFTPFSGEYAKSNRSNPFISAPFRGILNENLSNKEGFLIGTTGIEKVCLEGGDKIGCYDISYIEQNTNVIKNVSAKIAKGYIIDASGYLESIPEGNVASEDFRSYMPITTLKFDTSMNEQFGKTSNKAYNPDNLDITYHTDPLQGISTDKSTAGVGKMWVDISGSLVSVPYSDVSNTTLFYQPGTYKYNSASYVPNYEESVFLSKLTNKPTTVEIESKRNLCEETNSSVIERDIRCGEIDIHKCGSIPCCVLLGGEKCVAGNESGPSIKSNYSDHTIINRDYYYYRGKCYGHCIDGTM